LRRRPLLEPGRRMIEVNEKIEVASPPEEVWKVLSDPQAVVECVKGASLGEQHEDGSYDAGLLVSFGVTKVTFKARFALELDPATLSGKVSSRGKDNQGGTRIQANMKFRIEPQQGGAGSSIFIEAETEVSGRMATIVETGASMVVGRMTADFARRLAARLQGNPISQED
jgi:carbon monoxide dehydrogenase subunit G